MSQRQPRSGFSLLEILWRWPFWADRLAVLSQIADTGMSAARESRDLAAARILCQTKLSEVLLDVTVGDHAAEHCHGDFDDPI